MANHLDQPGNSPGIYSIMAAIHKSHPKVKDPSAGTYAEFMRINNAKTADDLADALVDLGYSPDPTRDPQSYRDLVTTIKGLWQGDKKPKYKK